MPCRLCDTDALDAKEAPVDVVSPRLRIFEAQTVGFCSHTLAVMSRVVHANSIDKSISELNLSVSPPSPQKSSRLAARLPSHLRVNTTKPEYGDTKSVSKPIPLPKKGSDHSAAHGATDGVVAKAFSVTNLDTGETIALEKIDQIISKDTLTTFSSPYAKSDNATPFKSMYDKADKALIRSIEDTPERFLKELRLCDSPRRVQPKDYFAQISGNFGVAMLGHQLVRGDKESIYTVYIMEVRYNQHNLASKKWKIYRRYRQFYALNEVLRSKGYKLPTFPPKKILGTFDPQFVAKRYAMLSAYLEKLLIVPPSGEDQTATPNPRHSQTLRYFFTDGMDELPRGLTEKDVSDAINGSMGTAVDGITSSAGGKAFNSSITLDAFQLIKVIGKGSFAKVVLVRKKDDGKLYAIKILKKDHIIKRKQVEHTITERAVLRFTRHPFIVQLHYAFQTSERLFFVLDYCSGGELFFHLGKAGEFREPVARFYTAELVLALSHLHSKGVVYRDLKPENVLLDNAGHVLIADFGLSKVLDQTALKKKDDTVQRLKQMDTQQTYSFCGTPEYLAPEILTRSGHGTGVDWWSLGMLLYEMLTGLPPWYTKDRRELFRRIQSAKLTFPPSISRQAKSLIQGFLERNVNARLGSTRAGGIDGIKHHEFFKDIDWGRLFKRELPTPFRPDSLSTSETDVSNFDKSFTRIPMGSVSHAGGDRQGKSEKDMFHNTMFQNFSYTGSPSHLDRDD